jgi:TonB family protein
MKRGRPVRVWTSILLFTTLHALSFAASPETMTVEEAVEKHLLLTAIRPQYPYEALARHRTGSGVFELTFDYESGRLREVHVVKSFNDRALEGYAIGTLKLWRAKPRSIHTLLVPVTFTFDRRR